MRKFITNNMTTKELKAMAKELKVKNWWNLKKSELIAAIEAIQNKVNEALANEAARNAQNEPEEVEEVVANEVINETEEVAQNEPETTEEAPKTSNKKQDLIEYNGKTQNLSQWAKELGMSGQTLYARLYLSKWSVEKAFTTPVKKSKKTTEEEA